jgi:hydrogenase maturation protease
MSDSCSVLIVGAGNEYRCDDGVGIMVARELGKMRPDNTRIVEGLHDATALLDLWQGMRAVYLIDAVRSGGRPGQIYRFNPFIEEMPVELEGNFSTHSTSVTAAIELGKSLGNLPATLVVCGIEGKNFSSGSGLTPEVEEAGRKISRVILDEIKHLNI